MIASIGISAPSSRFPARLDAGYTKHVTETARANWKVDCDRVRLAAMNPVLDFHIDKSELRFAGRDLQRPECILAERDGTLWSADARGGVVKILPDGTQTIITQNRSAHFSGASTEGERYLRGTLPNGLAFARNGDFLIANFGVDCLEVMSRDGESRVLADTIDGQPIGKVNFVLRDSKDRIWVTISTKVKNWMHALRTDLQDGYIARYEDGRFRIVADGFGFTNEIRFDAREEFLYVVETTGGCITRLRIDDGGERCRAGNSLGLRIWERELGRMALPSMSAATFGEPWWCIRTSYSC